MLALLAAAWILPQDGLSPAALRRDVQYLSSDELEGRETGTRGERVAGRWIEARFRRLGLEPLPGGFLHEFPAEPVHLDLENTRLGLSSGPQAIEEFEAGPDFLPHPGTAPGSVEGPLVFAGYGLYAPEQEYDDFDGLDLAGKVVLLLRWEPQAQDGASRFDGRRLLPQSRLAAKLRACEERGAAAVLLANPPGLGLRAEAPGGYCWPQFSGLYNQVELMVQAQVDLAALERTNFTVAEAAAQNFMGVQNAVALGSRIPVAYVSQAVLERAFATVGRRSQDWVRETDASGVGSGFETLLRARIAIATAPVVRSGRNVIGLLRGGDPALQAEYVVVCAHYDHVGRNPAGEIWNGADDNASGTAAMLGLAASFAVEGRRPRRSLVFVAFAGEEVGLVGSARWLGAALLPEERIATVVNLDMVGRSINRAVHVIGTQSSPILRGIVERAAQGLELHLDYESEEFFDRSDQAPFYYFGIPVVFFNTSEHPDYHRPTDTWDRLNYDSMAAIGVLARRVTLTLADLPRAPVFQDGYHRLVPVFGREPQFRTTIQRISYDQRLDY